MTNAGSRYRIILCSVAVAGALLPLCVHADDARPGKAHEADVHRMFEPVIEAELVPGVIVGILKDGKTSIHTLGQLAPKDDRQPDQDTVYEIGSISKVFTGILLAHAVQKGEVKLDDPLSKHLPDGITAPTRDGEPILLWHLTTHTSGLPRMPMNMVEVDPVNPYANYDRDDLWAGLAECKLATKPGEKYAYSNLATGLLGTILAEAAGMSYEELVRERIAKPLRMKDTSITLSDSQKRRLAPPHDSGCRLNSNWEFKALAGAGAIRSTVRDMFKLMKATLSERDKTIHKAIRLSAERRFSKEPGNAGIGLGWHIAGDGDTLWHNGQTGGYHCSLFVSRKYNIGVVALSNGADGNVTAAAEKLIQTLCGDKPEPPKIRRHIKLSTSDMKGFVGEYACALGFVLHITLEDDALYARIVGQPAIRVYPESRTRFFYRAVEAELEFEIDDKTGKTDKVTLFQNGMEMPCKRVK